MVFQGTTFARVLPIATPLWSITLESRTDAGFEWRSISTRTPEIVAAEATLKPKLLAMRLWLVPPRARPAFAWTSLLDAAPKGFTHPVPPVAALLLTAPGELGPTIW